MCTQTRLRTRCESEAETRQDTLHVYVYGHDNMHDLGTTKLGPEDDNLCIKKKRPRPVWRYSKLLEPPHRQGWDS